MAQVSKATQRNNDYLKQLQLDIAEVRNYAEAISCYSKIKNEFELSELQRKALRKIVNIIREPLHEEHLLVTNLSASYDWRTQAQVEYKVLNEAFNRIKAINKEAKTIGFEISTLVDSKLINKEEYNLLKDFKFQVNRKWSVELLLNFLTIRASYWSYGGFLEKSFAQTPQEHRVKIERFNAIANDLNSISTTSPSDLAKDVLVAINFAPSRSKLVERVLS